MSVSLMLVALLIYMMDFPTIALVLLIYAVFFAGED